VMGGRNATRERIVVGVRGLNATSRCAVLNMISSILVSHASQKIPRNIADAYTAPLSPLSPETKREEAGRSCHSRLSMAFRKKRLLMLGQRIGRGETALLIVLVCRRAGRCWSIT
jgi:hypothetical protein